MEQPQVVDDNKVFGNVKKVSIEEANKYLQICEAAAGKKAIGTAMCILSPVMLIFMAVMRMMITILLRWIPLKII